MRRYFALFAPLILVFATLAPTSASAQQVFFEKFLGPDHPDTFITVLPKNNPAYSIYVLQQQVGLVSPLSTADVPTLLAECKSRCNQNGACRGFTFIRPGLFQKQAPNGACILFRRIDTFMLKKVAGVVSGWKPRLQNAAPPPPVHQPLPSPTPSPAGPVYPPILSSPPGKDFFYSFQCGYGGWAGRLRLTQKADGTFSGQFTQGSFQGTITGEQKLSDVFFHLPGPRNAVTSVWRESPLYVQGYIKECGEKSIFAIDASK